ncbi:MAG: twin-arginine translocation signal domain-containing protein, partial [Patescibacteria group bacterium]|nr:twin-arginine translocation signal domain-containing protein [Patescibacteria group bacterium]
MPRPPRSENAVSRRGFLAAACAAPAVVAAARSAPAAPSAETTRMPADVPDEDYRVEHGRIKQSVYGWPFAPMPMDQLIRASHRMGIRAMDVGRDQYPLLKELG